MDYEGCVHLTKYKLEYKYEFTQLYACMIACHSKKALAVKAQHGRCFKCRMRCCRLHACLMCVYIGCYEGGHIHDHASSNEHYLAADIDHGHVYCFMCKDYVYDSDLQRIAVKLRRKAAIVLNIDDLWKPSNKEMKLLLESTMSKKIYPDFCEPWVPPSKDFQKYVRDMECQRVTKDSFFGLRGFVTFGNTCYLNCVLQVLMHTSSLYNYFLSDEHVNDCLRSDQCITCELSNIFQEYYSGTREPFVPIKFLHLLWSSCKSLATNRQLDACECFLYLLDVLDDHCRKSRPEEKKTIVHRFECQFLNFQECTKCENTLNSTEACLNIALALEQPSDSLYPRKGSTKVDMTLENCLEKAFNAEEVQSSSNCDKCGEKMQSLRNRSISKFPEVLSFLLQRYSEKNRKDKKLDTFVSFPEIIDMTPYGCPLEVHRDQMSSVSNIYYLFAIICHKGTTQKGHYYAYIRHHGDQWFLCDDNNVREVERKVVMNFQACMLFYQRQD